jgi:hypothetical protein
MRSGGASRSELGNQVELSLCDTEIPHLVETTGYSPEGEGLACPLLKSTQILDRFDYESHQPEILIIHVIVASRLAFPHHRLLCTQHCGHNIRDLVEVRHPNACHHLAAMISGMNKKPPGSGSGEWHG